MYILFNLNTQNLRMFHNCLFVSVQSAQASVHCSRWRYGAGKRLVWRAAELVQVLAWKTEADGVIFIVRE